MATSYYTPLVFKEGTDAPSASAPLKFILTDKLNDSDITFIKQGLLFS